MSIAVTGAAGNLGQGVVESLLSRGVNEKIVAITRVPEKIESFQQRGVEVRPGDFDDPASLVKAFAGVDRLLIISTGGDNPTRIRQHQTAALAAKEAGVGFIAYTSIANASHNTLGLAEVHRATENAIRQTGISFSFLRNNWYLENESGYIQAALAGAPIVTSAGNGKIGWALRTDYAQAAAAVLAGTGNDNTIYELGGTLATYEDFAAALGQVLKKKVSVEHVDDETYGKSLAASGMPDFVVAFLVGSAHEISQGALDVAGSDLAKILGRPAVALPEALKQLVEQIIK